MRVSELIEILKKENPELEVSVSMNYDTPDEFLLAIEYVKLTTEGVIIITDED